MWFSASFLMDYKRNRSLKQENKAKTNWLFHES
jgi:hypothetical protein